MGSTGSRHRVLATGSFLELTDANVNGVVDNAEQVDRAEAVVKKLRGVREVRNKLIQSSMFVWDQAARLLRRKVLCKASLGEIIDNP